MKNTVEYIQQGHTTSRTDSWIIKCMYHLYFDNIYAPITLNRRTIFTLHLVLIIQHPLPIAFCNHSTFSHNLILFENLNFIIWLAPSLLNYAYHTVVQVKIPRASLWRDVQATEVGNEQKSTKKTTTYI